MIWQILLCALAAAGLLLVFWLLGGLLLLPLRLRHGYVVLFVDETAQHLEQSMRALSWLSGSGLLSAPTLLVDCEKNPQLTCLAKRLAGAYPQTVWLPADKLSDYLKMECT